MDFAGLPGHHPMSFNKKFEKIQNCVVSYDPVVQVTQICTKDEYVVWDIYFVMDHSCSCSRPFQRAVSEYFGLHVCAAIINGGHYFSVLIAEDFYFLKNKERLNVGGEGGDGSQTAKSGKGV